MIIVAVGNITDGIVFVGPFLTRDDVREWAEKESRNSRLTEWTSIDLKNPDRWSS